MRKNVTQEFAGAIFGVSQATVSRRWDLLRPVIGQVLAEFVPPRQLVGTGTVLVDGTLCPCWDWKHIPDLYSAKAGYPGMNIQIATTLNGRLAAVGPIPVHGARHDAHSFAASGLTALLADIPTAADLGYVGVEGIDIVPFKRLPGGDLDTTQAEFNTALSKIRAPSNTPSRTSKHGECSARKVAGTEHRYKNTKVCSKPSSDYSSSQPLNKPHDIHDMATGMIPVHVRRRFHAAFVKRISPLHHFRERSLTVRTLTI
jgi:DDE superfamily endonuclease